MLKKITLLAGLFLSSIVVHAVEPTTTAVPEPESLSLVMIGLCLIGLIVIRKK